MACAAGVNGRGAAALAPSAGWMRVVTTSTGQRIGAAATEAGLGTGQGVGRSYWRGSPFSLT